MTAVAPRRRTVLRVALFVLMGVVITALSASPTRAMRHLRLLRSTPPADTVLTTSPDAIRLWFSEPVNVAISKIALASANGTSVALAPITRAAAADAPLVAMLKAPLADGRYTVTWKTMSKDGHVVDGTFAFQLRATE